MYILNSISAVVDTASKLSNQLIDSPASPEKLHQSALGAQQNGQLGTDNLWIGPIIAGVFVGVSVLICCGVAVGCGIKVFCCDASGNREVDISNDLLGDDDGEALKALTTTNPTSQPSPHIVINMHVDPNEDLNGNGTEQGHQQPMSGSDQQQPTSLQANPGTHLNSNSTGFQSGYPNYGLGQPLFNVRNPSHSFSMPPSPSSHLNGYSSLQVDQQVTADTSQSPQFLLGHDEPDSVFSNAIPTNTSTNTTTPTTSARSAFGPRASSPSIKRVNSSSQYNSPSGLKRDQIQQSPKLSRDRIEIYNSEASNPRATGYISRSPSNFQQSS